MISERFHNKDILNEDERLDDLGRKGYEIIQSRNMFCFGIDAVLLSEFANVKEGENVLDLGTGTGIIPILLEAKTKGKHFTALEIQEESVDMAKRSVDYNGLDEKIDIIKGDIKEASKLFKNGSMDVITTNPPYMTDTHGLKNPELSKAIARHEVMCNLEDVVRESSKILNEKGRFYMVHRPHRMAEIIEVMRKYKLEPKRIRMVHSYVDKEATMVLIEAFKGGKTFMKIDSPLIIYSEQGVYTEEVRRMYYGE